MKEMVKPGEETCPFEFNFDAKTFKPGDMVSYRVTGTLSEMPFVGVLLEVHDDHVILTHGDGTLPPSQAVPMRGTREDRPLVEEKEAMKA